MIVSFQDEFGGYCSRLRIDSTKKRATCDKDIDRQDAQMQDEDGPNIDINLCKLLNIDVDKIALRIAMGEDPWADDDEYEEPEVIVPPQARTVSKSQKKCENEAHIKIDGC